MTYFLYAIIGLAPSFIWLLFYLRKDKHPEPNRMILKIFIWGMLIGPVAIAFEFAIKWLLDPVSLSDLASSTTSKNWVFLVNIILIAPIVEEFLKYRIVKDKILKNPEFDEPLDAMLYLIIAALGFAAVENLLLVFQQPLQPFKDILALTALRFISATFLHALASGILGYWLARSLREPNKKFRLLAKGFGLAIFFHSAYNFLTWLLDIQKESMLALAPIAMIILLLSVMTLAVSYGFSVLKRTHSVCKICANRRQ